MKLAFLLLSVVAAASLCAGADPKTISAAPAAAPVQRAYADPVTGVLRAPTADEALTLPPEHSAQPKSAVQAAPQVSYFPDGTVAVRRGLPGMHKAVARVTAGGALRAACSERDEAAR